MGRTLTRAQLFDDYVAGGARAFFPAHPSDPDARLSAVRRARRPLTPDVALALEAQSGRLPPSPARDANIASLRAGAACVVTGQQAGLFLGPLYTTYKAATAVVAARRLAEESGEPVVPVFWLQVEDHDLAEIAVVSVPGRQGSPVELRAPDDGADRVSVVHRVLPGAIDALLATLREELAGLPHAEEHLARLARHYRAGVSWSDAFAGVLAELFAPEGLVIVQVRDPALAAAAAPIHREALARAKEIARSLAKRRDELEDAGYAAPVHVRDGAPLAFLHPRGTEGPRYRLEPRGERWAEVGGEGVHDPEALLALLDRDPLAFSTSALLRPLVQDALLPTAAYVGGPGEVAYLAQLQPVYELLDKAMPLVVPRARFRVVDEGIRRLLDKLGLDAADAALPEDELLTLSRASRGGGNAASTPAGDVRHALTTAFMTALGQIEPEIVAAGQGLDRAVQKSRAAVEDVVRKLAAKYEKALLHRDETTVADVRRLKLLLDPGEPQERVYGLAWFAARVGDRAFVESVLAHVEPFDFTAKNLP